MFVLVLFFRLYFSKFNAFIYLINNWLYSILKNSSDCDFNNVKSYENQNWKKKLFLEFRV